MSASDRPVRYPLTVFYDASCPMCAGEMEALKVRDRDGRLALVDCSAPEFDENALLGDGLKRRDLMALIHVRDAHGRWFVGPDALALAYGAAGLKAAATSGAARGCGPGCAGSTPGSPAAAGSCRGSA